MVQTVSHMINDYYASLFKKRLGQFTLNSPHTYSDECIECSVKQHCSGLFLSSERRHSRAIKATLAGASISAS
jgi:hypothetical protein